MKRALAILALCAAAYLPRASVADDTDLGEIALASDFVEIVRKLGLRTGRAGEYGTGWGYKKYDFATDIRSWDLNVPGMTVSCNGSSSKTSRTLVNTAHSEQTMDVGCYNTPLALSESFIMGASLVETADTYGDDGCAQAAWRVWLFPAETNQIDLCAIALVASNRVQVGMLGVGLSDEPVASSVQGVTDAHAYQNSWGTWYPMHYSMSGFRVTSIAGSGNPRSVTFEYDVDAVLAYSSANYATSYTATQTATLTASLTVNSTVTLPSTMLINDHTQHMIWDPGLSCTWQMAVTNGVFYTRKVSDTDYRKNEFAD